MPLPRVHGLLKGEKLKEPYQIILDVWEANTDFDPKVLIENDIKGIIVRLNDMNGGHHMDVYFEENWEKAKQFPIQALYFVYNPWVDGKTNFDFLMKHLPSDYGKRRIFVDIEVRYKDYSPVTYRKETSIFCNLVRKTNPCTRYSGGGFLNLLDYWPIDEEYWWASYSDYLRTSTTWEIFRRFLSMLSFNAFTKLSPGPCKLWQSTGDGVRLPGFGDHAVDTNIFPGTLEECVTWFGCENITEDDTEDETSMAIPIGLYTKVEGWTKINPNFNFIAGAAQIKDTVDPNPRIKPIQEEAQKYKLPFLLWWEHYPWAYSEQQWGESNWPTEEADYIFQNFKTIMGAREYQAVVVSIDTYEDKRGKEEAKQFVAFSALQFIQRVKGWLKVNRPLVPLIVATSNDFIARHAPNINNWIHNYETMAVQPVALKDSYPVEGSKPAYLGVSKDCPWWRYFEAANTALIIFRGATGYPPNLTGMRSWLNLSDPGTDPDPDDDGGETDLIELGEAVSRAEQALRDIRNLLGLS